MEYPILGRIKSPEDVKTLNTKQIDELCGEIRSCIIETVSKNGGHLASNLGTVELTVALHRVFSSPKDAIIFDVGHQCYAHKLLTGRFDKFDTLRKENGISGFMRPDESEHDPFITGHSSNSISAAYGIYKAKQLLGEDGTAVAVIGDGALTGGMAYEALNNAGNGKSNFVVILNDNEMSISKNVGSLAKSLTKMRNKPKYHHFKLRFSKFLLNIPFCGKYLHRFFHYIKEVLKGVVYRRNLFTALGFNYFGPVNGHDVAAMQGLMEITKEYSKPSLIHVITTKGKGYGLAEKQPNNYHGVSPFDIEKGAVSNSSVNFSAVAGETLCELAESDAKICAITAAMAEGTGLSKFAQKHQDRFFDVGIAEQHAVTFAAGLAKQGLKPFFAVYSSFLQRGYDQLIHDVATANLPVRLLVDRAGIVGEDGETHQGLFDISYLRSIPNITIYSPSTYDELRYRIKFAANNDSAVAIRYPRGGEVNVTPFNVESDYCYFDNNSKAIIVTYGRLYGEACTALRTKTDVSLLKLNKIYPLPDGVIDILKKYDNIYLFEETEKSCGIGEYLSARLLENSFKGEFKTYAVNNKFVPASSVSRALELNSLNFASIIKELEKDGF